MGSPGPAQSGRPSGRMLAGPPDPERTGEKIRAENFFWPDLRSCLDDVLKPAGMTYEDLKSKGMLKGNWKYRSYERNGFGTPSKKVEIYSSRLKDWGYDPLPTYRERSARPSDPQEGEPVDPDLGQRSLLFPFRLSESSFAKKIFPRPGGSVASANGRGLGVREGDWVHIETQRGRSARRPL